MNTLELSSLGSSLKPIISCWIGASQARHCINEGPTLGWTVSLVSCLLAFDDGR